MDDILIEKALDIYINSEPLVNILCLPKDLKELAMGFLYSVGIINSFKDIKVIKLDKKNFKIYIQLKDKSALNIKDLKINAVSRVIETSSSITSPWRETIQKALEKKEVTDQKVSKKISIRADQILSAIKQMQTNTKLYRKTGGCHGAALFDFNDHLLSVKEDIGRHNAIDKVIGDLIVKNKSFEECFLTSTGRLTGDSVLKAVRAQIPIIASVSAAIDSGIRLAEAYNITLIGFVRDLRMNIYTYPHRIKTR
jgi:FdhD protein